MTAFTKFDYLLNALESAGQQQVPADHGYGEKRRAVLQHVADQSVLIDRCRDALSMPCDRWNKRQALIVTGILEAIATHRGQS